VLSHAPDVAHRLSLRYLRFYVGVLSRPALRAMPSAQRTGSATPRAFASASRRS
jgi:hypothetical protein